MILHSKLYIMSADQNKKLVQRLFDEGMSLKNLNVADEILDASYTNSNFPGAVGPEGFKQVMTGFLTAFPNMKLHVEEIIAEGNTVATRGYFTGTHDGDFMGIPASGKNVKTNYMDFFHFANGKCVENWVQMDMVGLMQQIGAMPEPA